MKTEGKKFDKRWRYLLVFLLVAATRCLCYMRTVDYTFRTDDVLTLIYPAVLSGHNWQVFFADTVKYYGYGYYWIFTPLFALISDYRVLLITIVVINNIFICATSMLVYRILTKYMDMPQKWYTLLLAVVSSFFVGDVPTVSGGTWYRTDNEIPFFFIIWILIWLLLKTSREDHKIKKIVESAFLGLVLVWALTVHERATALIIAVLGIEIYLFIVKRKWLFNPIATALVFVPGYFIHKKIKAAICLFIWGRTSISNSDAFAGMSGNFLSSAENFKAFLIVLVGNLHSLFIKTYGIPVFVIIFLLVWIGKNGIIHNLIMLISRKKDKIDRELPDSRTIINMIMGSCYLIILIGMSIKWGGALVEGLTTGAVVYAYKGICYGRYYYMLTGPLVVTTIAFAATKINECRKSFIIINIFAVGLWAVIEGIFYKMIVPMLQATGEGVYMHRAINMRVYSSHNFMFGMATMLLCLLIIPLAITIKKYEISGYKLVIIIILLVTLRNRQMNISNVSLNFIPSNSIDEFVESIEAAGYELPDTIYVDKADKKRFTVRFIFRDEDVQHRMPELGETDQGLLFSEYYIEDMIYGKGYSFARLGKSWYVYSNIPEYSQILQELDRSSEYEYQLLEGMPH